MRQTKITLKKIFGFLFNLPKAAAVALINAYQLILSPDHSWLKAKFPHGYCKFYPSCSQYSKEAFIKFGFLRGLVLSVMRVLRCHPWAEPKIDMVPNRL
jgi:hypothetical protein